MSTELVILTQTDLQSAGSVLEKASSYLTAYQKKHADLLKRANSAGPKLPKELDDDLMAWQVSAKKAGSVMEEARKPYTGKAHSFIKAFTTVENEISKSLYDVVQNIRDNSAKLHAEEAAALRAKEQAELAAKQRRIDDKLSLENQLRAGYAKYLQGIKNLLLRIHANVTLETYKDALYQLETFTNVTIPQDEWEKIELVGPADLISEVRTVEKFEACKAHFTKEIAEQAKYLLDLMPARKEELERGELESKQAAELALKAEQEAEEARKIADARAKQEAEKAKQQVQVSAMINEANRDLEAPKAIESYSINVTSMDGWRAIIDYYMMYSGTSAENIGNIKLDQMKAFAEKQAKATGELITHDDIVYQAKYKAVARATKRNAA